MPSRSFFNVSKMHLFFASGPRKARLGGTSIQHRPALCCVMRAEQVVPAVPVPDAVPEAPQTPQRDPVAAKCVSLYDSFLLFSSTVHRVYFFRSSLLSPPPRLLAHRTPLPHAHLAVVCKLVLFLCAFYIFPMPPSPRVSSAFSRTHTDSQAALSC